ncbi:hypothetical protein COOONC_00520 [Cooperia oncophora]
MTTSTTTSAPKITIAKQQLTRQIHTLEALLDEANEYSPTWVFPTESSDLKIFITTQRITLTNLKRRIEQQSDKLGARYESLVQASSNSDGTTFQPQIDAHWEDKRGYTLLNLAGKITQQLDNRLTELDCQEATLTLIKNNYNIAISKCRNSMVTLTSCKGDAARSSLRMILRTGDSYERAMQQLKNQYEDPKRITMQMIPQLKTMKHL